VLARLVRSTAASRRALDRSFTSVRGRPQAHQPSAGSGARPSTTLRNGVRWPPFQQPSGCSSSPERRALAAAATALQT